MTPLEPRQSETARTAPDGAAARHAAMTGRLDRLEALARRMDMAFRIPLTRIRIGWDAIIGLVPGIGDTLALAPAIYILNEARDMGASNAVLARMVANTGIDWLVGLVPVVGDILDIGVKSNIRNVALLREHLER